jgi:hypothetical protein
MIKETLALAWGNSFSEKHFIITDLINNAGQPAGTKVTVAIPLHLKP